MKVCCKFFILLLSLVLQLKCDAEALATTVTSDYFTVDTRREYFVRFNANEDEDYPVTGIMENQHFYFNEEKELTSNAYKRVGFDFGGWVVHPIHVAKNYDDGEVVKNLTDEDGKIVELYALWIPKVVKITFKPNSSPPVTTFSDSTHYCVVGKVFQQTPWCGTTRDGIDFDGWYTDLVGGFKLVPGETRVPAVDTIYYGRWTVEPSEPEDPEYDGKGKNYLVKFDANGGELIDGDEARVVASGSPIGTLPNAAKDGCEFEGWYTAATNGIRVTESTIVSENVTYYAHWKECMDDGSDDGTGGGSENGDYIRNVTARQRFPWNGLVDIKCDVVGVEGSTNEYKFVVAAVMPDSGDVREVSHIWTLKNGEKSTDLTVAVDGNFRLLWDAEADLGQVCYSNMVVRVTLDVQNKSIPDKVQLWEGGPYWATKNIGAEKPGDYGYYFWWGDTVGYKRENNSWVASDGSNSNFSFISSKAPTRGKSNSTLQSEGWITSDGVLAPEHDAAHIHWGGDWRMPTKQELDDLISKCDWTLTTMHGVNGYIVRGRGSYASNSIYFPCAGFGYRTSLNIAGAGGDYWSSVPDSDDSLAWGLFFDSGNHDADSHARDHGRSVRPLQGLTK